MTSGLWEVTTPVGPPPTAVPELVTEPKPELGRKLR
jgi:hypothetical protein